MTAWDFATAFWGRPGMQALCLELQDAHRQCVALLLWRLWTIDQKRRISLEILARAIDVATAWNGEVLIPLRAVRIGLTPHPWLGHTASHSVRDRIQTAELAAERVLLNALELLAPAPGEVMEKPLEAMKTMIEAWGPPAPATLLARLVAAP